MKTVTCLLLVILSLNAAPRVGAQEKKTGGTEVFEKLCLLTVRGDQTDSTPVRLRLTDEALVIESRKRGGVLKSFPYADLKSAEYSYSQHPRWKAGVGTASSAMLYAPLLVLALSIAIPLAFSKAKRHWLTIRSDRDYVVLKLDKNDRKVLLAAFEVRSHIKVEALGESK